MEPDEAANRHRLLGYLEVSPIFGRQSRAGEPAGLTDQDREALAQEARIEELEDGDVLWQMGDKADGLGIVLEGVLAVRRPPEDGLPRSREDGLGAVLRRLGPGDEVGFSTLGGQPHTADLTAVGPMRVAILPHARTLPLLAQRPGLALRMLAHLGHIIGLLTDEKLELLHQGVRDRVELWVLRNVPLGEEIPVSQEHIAECVNATRPRVSQTLKELERDGVVELRRGHVKRLR